MAHELTIRENGQVEFAYLERDGLPWHGLGQPMKEGEELDVWQRAAGMEWKIQRSKIRYATAPNAAFLEFPEQHVLFRSDSKAPLGVVSDRYQIVQPKEVIEFFRDIAKAGGLELSAAGTIFGGKRFWATAKIGEASPTSVADKVGGFLLISTSADGSLATEVRRTTVRTVCSNTLAMAMADAPASMKVTHRSVFDSTKVKEFMGLNEAAWDAFKHQINALANKRILVDQAEHLTEQLLAPSGDVLEIGKVVVSPAYNKILDLFKGQAKGSSFDGAGDSAWGWLNACTEYADWWARARSNENRFVSALWGPNSAMKSQALALAMAA